MPYIPNDGFVADVLRATRAIQCYAIRQDTLAAQSIQVRPDQNSIGAVFNYLKTQTTVTFPSTAFVEGWWWEPGADQLFVQVWDPSFATVAQNDIVPVNVL